MKLVPPAAAAALAALLAPSPARAQPAFVAAHDHVCGAFAVTTGGTFDVPILSAVPAGHTLIVSIGISGQLGGFTLSDTQGNTWTLLENTPLAQPSVALYGATIANPLTTADHLTLSYTLSTVGSLLDVALAEYSGIASLPGARDQLTFDSGTSTVPSATFGPTTQASEILVGSVMAGGLTGSSFSFAGFLGAASAPCASSSITQDYDVVSSIGTYTYGWNYTNSVPWALAFVSLKAGTTPVGLLRFGAR